MRRKTDGYNYGANIERHFARNLRKVYRIVLAYMLTNAAFALPEIETVLLVNVGYQRNRLREVDVDGFAVGKLKIEGVGCGNRAGLNTNRTTAAPFLYYVAGFS